MNRFLLSLLLIAALVTGTKAENKENVLLTINGSEITKGEFLYIYQKNNPGADNLFEAEEIGEYLDLFINFKLKVHAAIQEGMHESPEFVREYNQYREELAKPYLRDNHILNDLLEEAYVRMQEEVKASHILIRTPENASPEDTLKAYNKLLEIREKAKSGEESFGELAKAYSQDPSAAQNAGNLGYFSVFDMTYPFENVVYGLSVGEISRPFRTQFGYHIAKLEDRRSSRGGMEAAHLMIVPDQHNIDIEEARALAKDLKEKLADGASFEELVREHSDDMHSRDNGGRLQKFRSTERNLPAGFIDAAFALEADGDISDPVETQFGVHLIKRLKHHPVPEFEAVESELAEQINKDIRSADSDEAFTKRIQKEHGFSEARRPLRGVEKSIGLNKDFLSGEWTFEDKGSRQNNTMFTIGDRDFTHRDYGLYLERNQSGNYEKIDDAIADKYEGFVRESVRTFKIDYLEENNPAFRNIVREYRDGLLLFEVMEEKVWNKASRDSAGLADFFENHKERYKGATIAHVRRFTLKDEEENARLANAESGPGDIKNSLSGWAEGEKIAEEVVFTSDRWNELEFSTDFESQGIGYEGGADQRHYYLIDSIEEDAVPPLNRIRGRVVADYQDFLEEKWLASLKEEYSIKIHEDVLQSIVGK